MQVGIFCQNKSTRLEAGTQMTKTNCDLIHFEESYFGKSQEAFICSQVKSSQGYTRVGQAACDNSNCSCLGASLQGLGF